MNEPNPDAQLDALFTLARGRRSDTSSVEFAFETRLLARLRTNSSVESTWARISWRSIPFFAACVVALAVWNAQDLTATEDAAAVANLDHPEALNVWDGLN